VSKETPPTDPSRRHWYSLADSEITPEELHPTRRGRARERTRRRHGDLARPEMNWMWAVIAVGVVGVCAVVGLILYSASRPSSSGVVILPTVSAVSGASQAIQAAPLPVVSVRGWDGKQRFTLLIMGIDKRPGETGTGFRTDTLILLSINPATKAVGMLSIPRDMYVPLPGQTDMQPINTAYVIGELQRPGAGPLLAMQAVQYNFGIHVNSYVVLSFDAVIGLVDAIGGIDINVPQTIDDPQYPDMNFGYDPLYISAGLVHMDGQLALKYARTRHQGTDYDRAERQQQVLLAIRQRLVKPEVLTSVLPQAPTIWNQVSKGFTTDLSFDQAVSLGWYAKDIPATNIQRATINDKYLLAINYNGDTVVVLNRQTIGQLMTQIFGADYSK